jgi:selenide, water dikinase
MAEDGGKSSRMMQRQAVPVTTDIVLLGAGHAHVQVIRAFGMNPVTGVRVTVITDRLQAPYSGMLPGCIAGDYAADDIHIDVARLARETGCRLIHAEATGIDRATKWVLLKERPPVAYDWLSINVGITPDLSGIAKATGHAVPVKPIAGILGRLERAEAAVRSFPRPAKLAVIGGGPAGIELAIALADRNRRLARFPSEITLIAGSGLAPALNAGMRRRARGALESHSIVVVEGDRAVGLEAGAVLLASGRRVETDVPFVSTSAKLPLWLTATDLSKAENGGIAVRPTLQSMDDEAIFAAGDCATMLHDPRPRAGVFAVRQGPFLARNLMAAVRGERLESYRPQRDFLTILRTGAGQAIAGRGRFLSVEGGWVWRWKDRIDQAFMAMFRVADADPSDESADMRCGGCAAKVGPDPLAAALARLPAPVGNSDIVIGLDAPDDAAVIRWGHDLQPNAPLLVQSVDQFRAFIDDAYLFGRIAANHALNDIHAMGGTPHHALALATLPHGPSDKVSEELFQLLAGARATLDEAGCPLAGGHSSEGEALALGLAVSGRLDAPAIAKQGGKAGDRLILTKALGSGIVFAADMRASAPAAAVEAMLKEMLVSNAAASRILRAHGARAMTDVSGFGLAGHLAEMLGQRLGAMLASDSLPWSQGVMALADKGFASSLLPENRRLIRHLCDPAGISERLLAILFDPQTAGGLLAAVPQERAGDALAALLAAGYAHAADIGALTGRPGISIG